MAIENSGDVTEDHLDVHISVYLHFLHNTLSDLAYEQYYSGGKYAYVFEHQENHAA
jgi:hypothetical protein